MPISIALPRYILPPNERVGCTARPAVGEAKSHVFTRRVEQATVAWLTAVRGGITVTTRPALNLLGARYAHPSTVLVGQEHVYLARHQPDVRAQIRRWYPTLDALVTLTEADRADYAAALGQRPRLATIPNALDSAVLTGPRSTLDQPVAVAVGRLTRPKGFDLLIRAWSRIARRHPDWQLRIYGDGAQRHRLQALIDRRELTEHVQLMGATNDIPKALAEASLFIMPSRWEGLSLAIVEAMAAGVPVVSYDCPVGPRELIRPGEGVLVPVEDVRELAQAVDRLIRRPKLCRRLAAAGRRRAADFTPDQITPQWAELFQLLVRRTRPRRMIKWRARR